MGAIVHLVMVFMLRLLFVASLRTLGRKLNANKCTYLNSANGEFGQGWNFCLFPVTSGCFNLQERKHSALDVLFRELKRCFRHFRLSEDVLIETHNDMEPKSKGHLVCYEIISKSLACDFGF